MSFNIGKYRILEASRFTAYDPSTDEFLWDADDLQSFKIANTQDNQEDTGKNGEVIGVRKQNKKVTVTFTNGTLVTGAIASQLGVSPESLTTAKVRYTDSVTITNNKGVTKFKAVGTTGNEIGKLYVRHGSSTQKTLTQDSTASATGKFSYDPSTKTITTFADDIEDGTVVVVMYDREVKDAERVRNLAGQYSKAIKAIVDLTVAEAGCNDEYFAQAIIYYLDCSGNFDITAGDQSVLDFEGTSVKYGCNTGANSVYYDFIVYDDKDAE